MTTTNISDLWRERQAAIAEFEVNDDEDPVEGTAWMRYMAADEAIRAARPITIAGLAVQMRLLEASIQTGHREDAELAASIAEQLEKLAPVA